VITPSKGDPWRCWASRENSAGRHGQAVWTGIGAVGMAALGIYLQRAGDSLRLARIGLIAAGIAGLKFAS